MFSLSGYFAFLTHQLPKSASMGHRRFNIGMGMCFAMAGVARWFA